jgi:hypothetical protein
MNIIKKRLIKAEDNDAIFEQAKKEWEEICAHYEGVESYVTKDDSCNFADLINECKLKMDDAKHEIEYVKFDNSGMADNTRTFYQTQFREFSEFYDKYKSYVKG